MHTVPCPTAGEILQEKFLKPMEITPYRLAKEIGVSQRRIGEIIAGKRDHRGHRPALVAILRHIRRVLDRLQDNRDRAVTKDALVETLADIKPWDRRRAA